MIYDYLIVGAGLFGATMAYCLTRKGKRCLVIDKRPHIGGNVYTESLRGINVHTYGAHIFHTSDRRVWDFVHRFAEFNRYTNSPLANYRGRLFNLPFNMNTFYQMWGVTTPEQAARVIEAQREAACVENPRNLEEQAISLVGKDIYETLVKGYTEKQWGRKATELPAFIIRRLPIRFTFDNNYFNDIYQGIPIGGYTPMVERMLSGIEVRTGVDYFEDRSSFDAMAERIIYTGEIDRYFDYRFGRLAYRVVRFETEVLEGVSNYQGNAVVNYTDSETPYTRIIEHKHFDFGQQPDTVVTREYPKEWEPGDEPYYPVNDERNNRLYAQYKALAERQERTLFGGRLGTYAYYDMHQVIKQALDLSDKL